MRYKEITNNTTERGLLNTYTVKATEKIKIDTEIAKLQWPKKTRRKRTSENGDMLLNCT